MPFQVKILGSSSAISAYGRRHSSQYLRIKNHSFLIDCGEGTQLQLMRYRIKYQRISHIFISHLHGDHYLGLVGLLSSMHLQHRTSELYLYGPSGLREIVMTQLKHSQTDLRYKIIFRSTNADKPEQILETDKVTVVSIPLQHRIHCTGFVFREKIKPHRLDKKRVPKDLSLEGIAQLRQGKDIVDEEGNVIIRAEDVVLPPRKSRSYAYCSDTIFDRSIIPYIKGVDLLYHETTFLKDREQWAADTCHTTTEQAGIIAREAEVEQLLIGHYSARYKDIEIFKEETQSVFPNTLLAKEGEQIEIFD